MESPYDSIERELEVYAGLLDAEDMDKTPFLTRMAGLKTYLIGWANIRPQELIDDRLVAELEEYFQRITADAEALFKDINGPQSHWQCYFEPGNQEVNGHVLLPDDDNYKLADIVTLPSGSVYHFDHVGRYNVPAYSKEYDLPLGNYSNPYQLYLGNTVKQVAVSLNQIRESLVQKGDFWLIPPTER